MRIFSSPISCRPHKYVIDQPISSPCRLQDNKLMVLKIYPKNTREHVSSAHSLPPPSDIFVVWTRNQPTAPNDPVESWANAGWLLSTYWKIIERLPPNLVHNRKLECVDVSCQITKVVQCVFIGLPLASPQWSNSPTESGQKEGD